MVCHQAKAVKCDLALVKVKGEALQRLSSIIIVVKDIFAVIPPNGETKTKPLIRGKIRDSLIRLTALLFRFFFCLFFGSFFLYFLGGLFFGWLKLCLNIGQNKIIQ